MYPGWSTVAKVKKRPVKAQRLSADVDNGTAGERRQTGTGLVLTAAETGSSSAVDEDVN